LPYLHYCGNGERTTLASALPGIIPLVGKCPRLHSAVIYFVFQLYLHVLRIIIEHRDEYYSSKSGDGAERDCHEGCALEGLSLTQELFSVEGNEIRVRIHGGMGRKGEGGDTNRILRRTDE
jgi:hypothetical protein